MAMLILNLERGDDMSEFVCQRCGACCEWPGPVRVSDDEIDDIAAFLGVSPQLFIDEYTCLTEDRRGLTIIEGLNGECCFYREGDGCVINPVKPRQCRDFPVRWNFPGWRNQCAGGQA